MAKREKRAKRAKIRAKRAKIRAKAQTNRMPILTRSFLELQDINLNSKYISRS